MATQSQEYFFDQYEHYNYDQGKYLAGGNSGKQRTKKEASQNTNRHAAEGHTRKITEKLQNTERKRRDSK